MATIKKPAKKMQMGGSTKYSLDKAIKDAGFGSKKLSPDTTSKPKPAKGKGPDTPIYKKKKATFNVPEVKQLMKKGGSVDTYTNYSGKTSKPDSYTQYKKGGVVKAKKGGSFPDLNKDGKITKADILKGRGVIAKKGAKLKKAQSGASFKNITDMFGRTGGFDGGMRNQMAASILKKKKAAAAPTMKSGGKMKKCAYGCK